MKTAIHTPTQEIFDKVIKDLKERGYEWSDSSDCDWEDNEKGTCVDIKNGDIENSFRGWYKDNGYKIISVEEYLGEWKQEDILIDEKGNEVKILGICGKVYIISEEDNFSEVEGSYTKKELEGFGFELKEEKDTVGVNIMGDNVCISTEVFCRDITKKSARELRNKLNNLNLI